MAVLDIERHPDLSQQSGGGNFMRLILVWVSFSDSARVSAYRSTATAIQS